MNSIPPIAAATIPTEPSICPICHDDLYRPEDSEFAGRHVALAKPCGHKFHFNCLARWTTDHLTCPYGRGAIEDMVVEILTLPMGWQHQMVNAAKNGNLGIIRALLNRGANVDANQTAGKTPLAMAAANKQLDVALLLAERGGADPIGLKNLGDLCQVGARGVPADPRKAERWYKKSAALGNDNAMNNLGHLYLSGCKGLPADPEQGKLLLFKAAGLGNVSAMYNLGYLYQHGVPGLEADLRTAERWYLEAARLGDINAMNNLGHLYQHGGKGLPAAPDRGKALLFKSAGLGNVSAMYNLGFLYQHGGVGFEVVLHLFAFDALMQRFFGHLIKSLMNLVKLNFGT